MIAPAGALQGETTFLGIALSLIFGCALHPKQDFDREAYKNVNKIVLIEPAEPQTYAAFIGFHPLVGALILAGDAKIKSERFTQALRKRELHLGEELSSSIEQYLTLFKFELRRLQTDRSTTPDLLEDYSAINADADAYLDVFIARAGFVANTATSDYVPSVKVIVRLVLPKTKEVVYSKVISYGYGTLGLGETLVVGDAHQYAYANFENIDEQD